MAAFVINQQRVTTKFRRRDGLYILRVEVVAIAGQQKLKVERYKPSETGFVEVLGIDLNLGLGEKFIVVFPEKCAIRSERFETLTVQMVQYKARIAHGFSGSPTTTDK